MDALDMNNLRSLETLLILLVTLLSLLFSIIRLRNKVIRLPFEIIYVISIFISVIRLMQTIDLCLQGSPAGRDYSGLISLQFGIYCLNLGSLCLYMIQLKWQQGLRGCREHFEKCDFCKGDLYAHGVPRLEKNQRVCGKCLLLIQEE
jgi:hypothetical protein